MTVNDFSNLSATKKWFDEKLHVTENFDLISRELSFANRRAMMYLLDGFMKDELLQKLLQYFASLKPEDIPENATEMCEKYIPYIEVETSCDEKYLIQNLFSGVPLLFVEGYSEAILMDTRTYPARGVTEPEKDKTLRGSKDGFVETIVFNTALIRRRIRDENLRIEITQAGSTSKTDIVICYMKGRADEQLLSAIRRKISDIRVDSLTMNQQSLAERLFEKGWFNPFPKYKFTERPDTAAAQILEGNIIILVDNSPFAMILPVALLDVIEEADDYYFPPVTGTYLRIARLFIALAAFLIPPTFLLFHQNRDWIPDAFSFVAVEDEIHVPLIWQFLILELAVDGLRLAAVNTPSMLSTPLSIMAGLVLGELSIKSGWFNSEALLYEAFVAVAAYTQPSYELSYAIKFFRIITLILTATLGITGYVLGILWMIATMLCNETYAKKGYLYPIIPLRPIKLLRRFIRMRLKKQ